MCSASNGYLIWAGWWRSLMYAVASRNLGLAFIPAIHRRSHVRCPAYHSFIPTVILCQEDCVPAFQPTNALLVGPFVCLSDRLLQVRGREWKLVEISNVEEIIPLCVRNWFPIFRQKVKVQGRMSRLKLWIVTPIIIIISLLINLK